MKGLEERHLPRLSLGSLSFSFFMALVTFLLLSSSSLELTAKWVCMTAILMAMLWLTEAVPLAATALLPLVLFPLFGVMPSKEVALHYGNHLIFLFLGGFMVALAMQECGLHKRIALKIIHRTGTKPQKLILGFMAASAFLSMWISNTATAMMLLPIGIAVAEKVKGASAGGTVTKALAPALMLAIAYGASIGGVATLVGTPPNIVLAGVAKTLYPEMAEISFGSWMMLGLVISLFLLTIVYLLLAKVFFKESFSRLQQVDAQHIIEGEYREMGPMDRDEIKVSVVFISLAVLWLTRGSLNFGFFTFSGWAKFFPSSAFIHDATVAMALGLLLFFLPSQDKDKSGLLTWDYFSTHTPWHVLILFGGGFALAAGVQESGVANWFADNLALLKTLPVFVTVWLACMSVTFLTELSSNTATATVLLPIMGPTAVAMGYHPFVLMVPVALSCSCAFMLPIATPPNLIVFSSGYISMKQMAKIGVWLNLISATVIALMTQLLAGVALGF